MKHINTLLLLVISVLCIASCNDDKRDIVFFAGNEPIYQNGTCGNLTSYIRLYPINPDGEIVGIDGGDGNYSIISNTNEAVVTVSMATSDKYKRLQLTPKKLGEAVVTISDGDGKTAALRVKVGEYGVRMRVINQGIIVSGEATDAIKTEITDVMKGTFPVAINGGFELISKKYGSWKDEGILHVYPESFEKAPVIGSYSWKSILVNDKEKSGFTFIFNNREYQFTISIIEQAETRSNMNSIPLYEDVTSECLVECPAGVKVYREYKLSIEEL